MLVGLAGTVGLAGLGATHTVGMVGLGGTGLILTALIRLTEGMVELGGMGAQPGMGARVGTAGTLEGVAI